MIYTAPCIMFWMRAYPLRGEVGGGWALEFESFWVLGNGIEPIGECHLGPKKLLFALRKQTTVEKFWHKLQRRGEGFTATYDMETQ
jgi:hypothetical protein